MMFTMIYQTEMCIFNTSYIQYALSMLYVNVVYDEKETLPYVSMRLTPS
jgi:hypothetical protein